MRMMWFFMLIYVYISDHGLLHEVGVLREMLILTGVQQKPYVTQNIWGSLRKCAAL